MPYLPNPSGAPGIGGLFAFRPQVGEAMRALAQSILRGPSTLDAATRELIATYVSSRNGCRYCTRSHAAVARRLASDERANDVDAVLANSLDTLDEKTRTLLAIADHVRAGVAVLPRVLVESARSAGWDDVAIHDATLIAAAFSMFNRYVESLDALTPDEHAESYAIGAERLATQGYR